MAPVLFGKIVHIDVQLSPAVEFVVCNVVVLVSFHVMGLPFDRAVPDEKSAGVYEIILGLRG